jgi:hypothetical protein
MKCPLVDCDTDVPATARPKGADGSLIQCPRCGRFEIDGTLHASDEFSKHTNLMDGLRAFIKSENEAGRTPVLGTMTWQQEASAHKPS